VLTNSMSSLIAAPCLDGIFGIFNLHTKRVSRLASQSRDCSGGASDAMTRARNLRKISALGIGYNEPRGARNVPVRELPY
jgi:hypothetical protein